MKPKLKKKEFRSSLETLVSFLLQGSKVPFEFEDTVLKFLQPAQPRKYNPDFRIPAGTLSADSPEVFLETKGQLTSADRKKMKYVKEQHPDVPIILIFGRASNRLNKKSETTYGDWASKYGFPWIDVADFQNQKDIKRCLLSLIQQQKRGISRIPRRKKSKTSSASGSESSLTQLQQALPKRSSTIFSQK